MSNIQPDFKPLRDEGLSLIDEKVLAIFESALDSLDDLSLEESASGIAKSLQVAIPVTDRTESKATVALEDLWDLLIGIAGRIPHRHIGQMLLSRTAANLGSNNTVAESEWNELPYLGRCMRESWIDPTFEPHEDAEQKFSLDEWLNVNSFASRLVGMQLIGWDNFAIWQLSHGLEDADMSPSPAIENRVAVAAEWAIQSGPELLRRCLLSSTIHLNEAEKRAFSGGNAYKGYPGLCLERWGFWKRRLGELRPLFVDASLVQSIDEAIETMSTAEVAIAATAATE